MELLHVIVRGEQVTALVAPSRATPLDPADRILELRDGGIVEH
jgi:putative ABC transport system ATP-binding protein